MEIYESLMKERDLEKASADIEMRYQMVSPAGTRSMLQQMAYDSARRESGVDTLPHQRQKTERLLAKHHQTRGEWNEGGERYHLAARWAHPDKAIFDKVYAEKQAKQALEDRREKEKSQSMEGKATTLEDHNEQKAKEAFEREIAELEADYKKKTEETNAVLTSNQARTEWFKAGSLKWAQYNDQDIVHKLETTYQRLLQAAAGRTLQYRQLHSQVSLNLYGPLPVWRLGI